MVHVTVFTIPANNPFVWKRRRKKMTNYNEMLTEKKDRALDFSGLRTGVPFDKRTIITLVVCIVSFLALKALPLAAYGETTSTALALVVVTFLMLMFLKINVIVPSMLIATAGFFLGLWDWNAVKTTVADSPMVMMTGMMIVAMGCEYTPMGKRIAYLLLKAFGQKAQDACRCNRHLHGRFVRLCFQQCDDRHDERHLRGDAA